MHQGRLTEALVFDILKPVSGVVRSREFGAVNGALYVGDNTINGSCWAKRLEDADRFKDSKMRLHFNVLSFDTTIETASSEYLEALEEQVDFLILVGQIQAHDLAEVLTVSRSCQQRSMQ